MPLQSNLHTLTTVAQSYREFSYRLSMVGMDFPCPWGERVPFSRQLIDLLEGTSQRLPHDIPHLGSRLFVLSSQRPLEHPRHILLDLGARLSHFGHRSVRIDVTVNQFVNGRGRVGLRVIVAGRPKMGWESFTVFGIEDMRRLDMGDDGEVHIHRFIPDDLHGVGLVR